MSTKLEKKATHKTNKTVYRPAQIWDHGNGQWVDLTEEELDKHWPQTPEQKAEEIAKWPPRDKVLALSTKSDKLREPLP